MSSASGVCSLLALQGVAGSKSAADKLQLVRLDPDTDVRDGLVQYLTSGPADGHVDILVCASRRIGVMERAASAAKGHGSFSLHALRSAPCPVLVVPQRTLELWARVLKRAKQEEAAAAAGGGSAASPMTPPGASSHQQRRPQDDAASPLSPPTSGPPPPQHPSPFFPAGAVPAKDSTVVGGGIPPSALLQPDAMAVDELEPAATGGSQKEGLRVQAGGPLHAPGEQTRKDRQQQGGEIFRPPGGWPVGATTLSDI